MKVLVATDAWHPQVNGVVRTLARIADEAPALGATIEFLTPDLFWNVPLPIYPEIQLALPRARAIEQRIAAIAPDAIHVATEGPLGYAVRRYCRDHRWSFTTSFHTRFPEYIAGRLPVPAEWTCTLTWAWLRRFHSSAAATLAATPSLAAELTSRGFGNVRVWTRGVDTDLFHPRPSTDLGLPRPVFLNVGRLALEKNVEAFLALDLPGSQVVVGDGPEGLAMSPKGDVAVAAILRGSNNKKAFYYNKNGSLSILKIDGKKVTKTQDIEVGGLPEAVVFTPDGKYLLAGNYLTEDFSILKVNGSEVTDTGKRFKVPGHPASARIGH